MEREAVTLTEKMSEQVAKYAKVWNVNKNEAMRRLFGLGVWVAETNDEKKEPIYKGYKKEKVIFNLTA